LMATGFSAAMIRMHPIVPIRNVRVLVGAN
jgi:hypothetical protein